MRTEQVPLTITRIGAGVSQNKTHQLLKASCIFLRVDANTIPVVQSPMEARTVRFEGGKLFVFKQRQGLTINITRMPPHEAALQILSFIRDLMARLDHELVTEETTPLEAKEPAWA